MLLRHRLPICLWSLASEILTRREKRPSGPLPLPQGPVALVKSAAYRDLPTLHFAPRGVPLTDGLLWHPPPGTSAADPAQWVLSTHQRTGPFALVRDLGADALIVRDEPDLECLVWQERRARDPLHPFWTNGFARQRDLALPAASVDWSAYSVVVALENAVPARITRLHPRTLWLTQMEDHRMQAWKRARRRPPTGYQGFLNLVAGPCLRSCNRRPHELEWPFTLLRPGAIRALFPEIPKSVDAHLETNQDPSVAPQVRAAGLTFSEGRGLSPPAYYRALCAARCFLCPCPQRPIYGSAVADAVAADCLVIGNRRAFWFPHLIQPELHAADIPTALRLFRQLARDPARCQDLLQRQRRALEWFHWERPLFQLQSLRHSLLSCPTHPQS